MSLLKNLVRKLFLVKEIVSKEGAVHFRRYRLLATPKFNIYVHNLLKSDEDADFHDHPWHFASLLLKGSYKEETVLYPDNGWNDLCIHSEYEAGDLILHHELDAHKLTLTSPEVWTLVFTVGEHDEWGYQTKDGWMWHQKYRQAKSAGNLPK